MLYGGFDVSGTVDKSLCTERAIAVRVGNVIYNVPRTSDARRWVTYNAPDVFWDRILRAVEEYERWERERGKASE